jgi:hypothetical protein
MVILFCTANPVAPAVPAEPLPEPPTPPHPAITPLLINVNPPGKPVPVLTAGVAPLLLTIQTPPLIVTMTADN